MGVTVVDNSDPTFSGVFGHAAADPVTLGLRATMRRLSRVALFSGVVNLLMLSGPIYMLQVYDRVLSSRNLGTLAGLSAIVLFAYLLQAYFDALRGRMLARIAILFDAGLQRSVHDALAALPLMGAAPAFAQQPLRDLDAARAFLSGAGPAAFLDLPWTPLFLLALFVFHPLIGIVALGGAAAIVSMAFLIERASKTTAKAAAEATARRQGLVDATQRNAEAVRALGMTERLTQRWLAANERHLFETLRASDVYANLGAGARILRFALQSAILGVAAYLVVIEQASGGVMVASSILMGRALAPIEMALGASRQFAAARQGVARLRDVLKVAAAPAPASVSLPRPRRDLRVEAVTVAAPGGGPTLVSDVAFTLTAGAGLVVLGPSASGKSTLAKALVGVAPLARGEIRLDGATLPQWRVDELGRHIGYLPQDVELLDGTVAENIARFDDAAQTDDILRAAHIAGAHQMILSLPRGYETRIGEGGARLSAGQRQRIGLARAAYGDPFLIVLDEPNANLDTEGEAALSTAIGRLREEGRIVIVVSHRPSALDALDAALVMYGGRQVAFGAKDDVFARLQHFARGADTPAAAPKINAAREGEI